MNGYRVIYKPNHPKSMTSDNWCGFIYEHIYVAEKYLGRTIRDDEVVHHLDGIRDNNHHTNLLVLPEQSHTRLHEWLERGIPFGERGNSSSFCEICDVTLQTDQSRFCSNEHMALSYRKADRPTKEELEQLIALFTWTRIGKMYAVSDNAVRKWAKLYKIL